MRMLEGGWRCCLLRGGKIVRLGRADKRNRFVEESYVWHMLKPNIHPSGNVIFKCQSWAQERILVWSSKLRTH